MSRNTYVLLATLGSAALLLGWFGPVQALPVAKMAACSGDHHWYNRAVWGTQGIDLVWSPGGDCYRRDRRLSRGGGVEVLAWPYVLHRWRTGPWRAQRQRSFVDGRPFGFGHVRRDRLADVRAVDGGMERRHQRCLTWPVGRGCACKTLGSPALSRSMDGFSCLQQQAGFAGNHAFQLANARQNLVEFF